ncbi:hypothetical protein ACJMK2_027807 [Sinanodonta woodiana]|uniref:Protein MIX23 n=1 Tax=Sinanodonta woodiana TaxID=1069815 RepID=A0ABD3X784_SINWO
MAASTNVGINLTCEDFLEFQEALKKMRTLDDSIVCALNTTIPTNSFASKVDVKQQCKLLYEQMMDAFQHRESEVKRCVAVVSSNVARLKEERSKDIDDIEVLKKLRKEQTKLRLMQNELGVEEVVRNRTQKVFYERCRTAYKPPNQPFI